MTRLPPVASISLFTLGKDFPACARSDTASADVSQKFSYIFIPSNRQISFASLK